MDGVIDPMFAEMEPVALRPGRGCWWELFRQVGTVHLVCPTHESAAFLSRQVPIGRTIRGGDMAILLGLYGVQGAQGGRVVGSQLRVWAEVRKGNRELGTYSQAELEIATASGSYVAFDQQWMIARNNLRDTRVRAEWTNGEFGRPRGFEVYLRAAAIWESEL